MKKIVALAVCTVALAVITTAQGQGQGQGKIRKANKPIRSQYIVVLNDDADPEGLGNEAAARFSGRLRHVYRSALRGFAVTLSEQAAATLAEDSRVRFVEEDAEFELTQLQSSPPWGLDRIDQRALPLDQTYTYGVPQPQQVTVHVIDTGIRVSHHEFAGRAFIGGDYVDDDQDGDPNDIANDDGDPSRMDGQDCHGHGTHVAGTIGGLNVGVAKNVIIQAHRVFTCGGNSALSGILAAIDAVTDGPRPAVANMSLGGGASAALDGAVQASIASGVTYTIAAGNANIDAGLTSPARVTQAITVGSTASNDTRSSFSNWGPALDLFAPGSSVSSASYTSDTGLVTMSGTSMAAPHAAGLAAMYLERNPSATPTQVRDALVNAATPGKVTGAGSGSPNLLLYSGFLNTSTVTVTLNRPDGGEKLYAATPYLIQWDVSNGAETIRSFDVLFAADGINYTAVSGCSNLPAAARSCEWTAPGPATSKGRMRVVATDIAGQSVFDTSAAAFYVYSGSAVITVSSPNSAVNWGRGSTQQIKWSHNLGANSYVRIDLSRDGGATFTETIAASVRNTTSSSGVYNWLVTGPNVSNAVVRVSWTNGSKSDVSNVGFTIAEPYIKVSAPSSTSINWGYETTQRVSWTTNLGALDQVAVSLSLDGTTFTELKTGVAASTLNADITLPAQAAPTTGARVRVTWGNAPGGVVTAGTNPVGFKIEPAFVTVTAPNGGEVWGVGTSQVVRWTNNLGTLETVDIQLSRDGGSTWTTVLAAKRSEGKNAFTIDPTWVTETGRIRIVWNRKPTVSDISNANFAVR